MRGAKQHEAGAKKRKRTEQKKKRGQPVGAVQRPGLPCAPGEKAPPVSFCLRFVRDRGPPITSGLRSVEDQPPPLPTC